MGARCRERRTQRIENLEKIVESREQRAEIREERTRNRWSRSVTRAESRAESMMMI